MTDPFQSAFWYVFSSDLAHMVNCSFIHYGTMIIINRLVTIIYPNKAVFKRHAWSFMSFAIQWIISMILPMPHLILTAEVSHCDKE
jgi:hypothetical protein